MRCEPARRRARGRRLGDDRRGAGGGTSRRRTHRTSRAWPPGRARWTRSCAPTPTACRARRARRVRPAGRHRCGHLGPVLLEGHRLPDDGDWHGDHSLRLRDQHDDQRWRADDVNHGGPARDTGRRRHVDRQHHAHERHGPPRRLGTHGTDHDLDPRRPDRRVRRSRHRWPTVGRGVDDRERRRLRPADGLRRRRRGPAACRRPAGRCLGDRLRQWRCSFAAVARSVDRAVVRPVDRPVDGSHPSVVQRPFRCPHHPPR